VLTRPLLPSRHRLSNTENRLPLSHHNSAPVWSHCSYWLCLSQRQTHPVSVANRPSATPASPVSPRPSVSASSAESSCMSIYLHSLRCYGSYFFLDCAFECCGCVLVFHVLCAFFVVARLFPYPPLSKTKPLNPVTRSLLTLYLFFRWASNAHHLPFRPALSLTHLPHLPMRPTASSGPDPQCAQQVSSQIRPPAATIFFPAVGLRLL
jgi:hypothetical protein